VGWKAEHLALLRPFGRQVGETGNTHAVRKPTIDGGFDEIRGEEGAFVASARLAFVAVEDTTSERSLLLAVKNNLGPKAGGLGYRLAQGFTAAGILASHVVWTPRR
jgi:hypothetical protein